MDGLRRDDRAAATSGRASVVIIPPIARAVRGHLAGMDGRYGHIAEMKRRAAALPLPTSDFSDLGQLGGSDCEFIDAVRVGDVGALRMILGMAINPTLASDVDVHGGEMLLSGSGGRAMLRNEGSGNEADFLNLGCRK